MELYGKKMASVKVDGEKQRNLWLSSLSPTPKRRPDNVVISRADYQEMIQEIDALAGALERLQTKVKSFHQ